MMRNRHSRMDESLIALRRILRATESYGRDLAQAAGITPAQLRILQIIDEKSEPTPKALATQMGVSQATVTSLVDKLVAQGLTARKTSELDRRQVNLSITDKGRRTLEHAPDALQQHYVRKFAELADWEQAQLVASLERVADMLDRTGTDAAPMLATGALQVIKKAD